MDILKHIDELRIERGWSMYKLAEMSGVTNSTLTNMYSRQTLPSLTTLTALCEAFGITMSDFFKTPSHDNETTEEEKILEGYRKLSADNKKLVAELIDALNDKHM